MPYAPSTPAARSSRDPTSNRPARATQGTPGAGRQPGHPGDDLAGEGLRVELALPGEHEVGAGEPFGEARRVRDHVDARTTAGRRAAAARTRAHRPPRPPAHRQSPGRRRGRIGSARRRRRTVARSRAPSAVRTRWWHPADRAAGWSRRWRPRSRRPASRDRTGARSALVIVANADAPPVKASGGSLDAPRAASMPAPPSFVPDPPSPTTTSSAPASSAAAISCPTPVVDATSATSGSGWAPVASRGSRASPQACADST